MQAKVEICGVNTSELPVYSGAQTDALLRRAAAGDRGRGTSSSAAICGSF